METISYSMAWMEKEQVRNEITAKVIDIIFSSLSIKHIDKSLINEETALTRGGLNLDSIDILELIVNFEKAFGIKVNESESYAAHFKNVGSIVDFVITQRTV